jgi:hypothetical protein
MEQIIDFFETSTITCTFDIPMLKQIISHSLTRWTTDQTVKNLSHNFVSLGLIEEASKWPELLAQHYDVHSSTSIQALAPYICPRIFAAILAEPKFANLTVEERIWHIDNYIGNQDLRDNSVCEAFESLIQWNVSDSDLYLTVSHCGWISAKRFRGLASQLLEVPVLRALAPPKPRL